MKFINKKAFSIIEILVWIFIFSLWLVSIYAIIVSTLRINDYNSNYIVAANLAKEQIELVRNIRDSNYKVLKPFDLKNPDWTSFNNIDKFEIGHYYKIENNFWENVFPISLEDITVWFKEWKDNLNSTSMQWYRLCINTENNYTYNCMGDNIKTEYYRFFYINKVENIDWIIEDSYKITSKVVWYKRWYHEFIINSIIADWKRL
jgi:Tfp pilus assembly protein PilV